MSESYFKDFANRLRERRDDLDITYQKIIDKTNLKKEWIAYIESGNFDFAPEVYVKGILRQYAAQIQMDPDEAVREYERIREKINFIEEDRYVEVKSFDANPHFSPKEIVDFIITPGRKELSEEAEGLEAEVKRKILRERKINFTVMSGGLLLVIVCLFYIFFDSSGRPQIQPEKKSDPVASSVTQTPVKKAKWELSEPIMTDQEKFIREDVEKKILMDSAALSTNLKSVSVGKNTVIEPISVQEAALYLEQKISN